MRTVVIGAGPTGLFLAIALARRGRDVVVIDRDPGPPPSAAVDGVWPRKGVMQFHHAHTFRGQVVEILAGEMPDVLDDLVHAGAEVAAGPDGPIALLCRRAVFEAVLHRAARYEPRVTFVTGHVDAVHTEQGRAVGVEVRGRTLRAELVLDASGRRSRVAAAARPAAYGEPCGVAYVSRQYQLRDADARGPVNSPIGLSLAMSGYLSIAFLHDSGTFTVTVNHAGGTGLRALRYESVFTTAVESIPLLADWVHPARAVPISPVLPGGQLYNSYRGQLTDDGAPATPGMIAVGDAVCTTTPLAGRGVALALLQSQELIRLLDRHGNDFHTSAVQFDRWCADEVKPWFTDHVVTDADRLRRWRGGDVDTTAPLPADLVVAAADADRRLRPLVAPYSAMRALPSSLETARALAAPIYESGWRPAVPEGPTADDLAEICEFTESGAA